MSSVIAALFTWAQTWAIIEHSRRDHLPGSTVDKMLDVLQSMNAAILRRQVGVARRERLNR